MAKGRITAEQYACALGAYAVAQRTKSFAETMLDCGLIEPGAVEGLLRDLRTALADRLNVLYALEAGRRGVLDAAAADECKQTRERLRQEGFEFDLLDLLARRGAMPDEAAAEIRQTVHSRHVFCPVCLEPAAAEAVAPGQASTCPCCGSGFDAFDAARVPLAVRASGAAAVGQVLGEYRILREIGRGGMGVVFEAEQVGLKRRVALKVLRANVATSGSEFERFHREAEALARVDHPNIVKIYGGGEVDGNHYFAMEYIEGKGLDRMLAETRSDVRRAAGWIRDIACAMQMTHEAGVVHRDIKPANILLDGKGRVILTDFGLAHLREGRNLTLTGEAVGTPHYMAPEQARGERTGIDARTDIYGLGITLYTLARGHAPFAAPSIAEVISKVVSEEPPPPSSFNRDVDANLEAVILKALRKDPGERYPSAMSFADDLDRWLRGERVSVRLEGWSRRIGRRVRRNTVPMAVGALLALMIGGVGLMLRRTGEDELARFEQDRREKELRVREEQARQLDENLGRQRQEEGIRLHEEEKRREDETRERERVRQEQERKREEEIAELRREYEKRIAAERAQWQAGAKAALKFAMLLTKAQADGLVRVALEDATHERYAEALARLDEAAARYMELPEALHRIESAQVAASLRADPEIAGLADAAGALAAVRRHRVVIRSHGAWRRWMAQGDWEGALAEVEAAAREDGGAAEPRIVRGLVLLRCGRREEAERELLAARELDPRDARVPLGLAEIRAARKEFEEARGLLVQALELNAAAKEVACVRGCLLLEQGEPEEALKVLDAGVPEMCGLRARAYLEMGRAQEALEATDGTRSYDGLLARARAALALGRAPEAREAIEAALRCRPDDPEARRMLEEMR